ncbi:hypothetical protein E2C01_018793 [Portunus trituberculatus]|uniref:Uncharacterized protein n=1 Tax=Portunus trituberculatus TaxID=210409 RepID=A0A5B7DVL7_PORTR|nr:hypothetical protein [Portunus trituberculatus]
MRWSVRRVVTVESTSGSRDAWVCCCVSSGSELSSSTHLLSDMSLLSRTKIAEVTILTKSGRSNCVLCMGNAASVKSSAALCTMTLLSSMA